MSVDRLRLSEELFHRALERPPHERERYVFEAAGDDWRLYREVSALLRHHEEPVAVVDASPIRPTGVAWFRRAPGSSAGTTLVSDVGRYRILEVLGEGGMGVVYLAEQTEPVRRRVALKVIQEGLDSENGRGRFESERQALALMNHPGIARVYEAGTTDDGRLFFAMEYVPGSPITRHCDEATLSIEARLRLFAEVCEAVHHAHQKGIIHRDLKPSNILVVADADKATPKIIDFGVAKSLNLRLTEHTVRTNPGVLVGSLEYMSPEQAVGRTADVDTRSDIYSLGVILYELVAGALPIDAHDVRALGYAEIERRIREQDPKRPSQVIAESGKGALEIARRRTTTPTPLQRKVQGDLDWITSKALEKERTRRYASASELAADIRRHLEGHPVLAGPPSRRYKLRKFVRRNRPLVAWATAAFLALAVGFATTTWLYLANRQAARLARDQRDDLMSLADVKRLEVFAETADRLAPPHPEMIDEMRAWLRDARELVARLPEHRRRILELEAKAASMSATTPEHAFQYDILRKLVTELERFADPNPYIGTLAQVERRLAFAERVSFESIDSHALEWEAAIASISNREECPLYSGLEISPQMGLVPIGRNPVSGLWEFAHLATGRPARRQAGGQLTIDEDTGIVLVLIPGARYQFGSESSGAQGWLEKRSQLPPRLIQLDPFFISKYEMTQSQWLRVTGQNPSGARPGSRYHVSLLQPVDDVTWTEAERVTRLVGLELPTEAQWECAARGGTTEPWVFGSDPRCLEGRENLCDRSAIEGGMPRTWRAENWYDGYAGTAPVGLFSANPFGLYDAIGNVSEWCRDRYSAKEASMAPDDGMRLVEGTVERVVKGGNFTACARLVPASFRRWADPEIRDRFGVRPMRTLMPPLRGSGPSDAQAAHAQ